MHNCTCTTIKCQWKTTGRAALCRLWHICYCEPSAFLYVNGVATKGHFPICCHEITLPTLGNDQPWKRISTQFIFLKDNSRWNTNLCPGQRVFIWRFIFLIFFNMQTICTPPVLAMTDCLKYKSKYIFCKAHYFYFLRFCFFSEVFLFQSAAVELNETI